MEKKKKDDLIENTKKDQKKDKIKVKNKLFFFKFKPQDQGVGMYKEPKKRLKLIAIRPDKLNLSKPPQPLQVGTLTLE